MRIGLYGMPTAGKTFILERIDFLDVFYGSKLLREHNPDFDHRTEEGREIARSELAKWLSYRDDFIMDGHYAFGNETAFTKDDGEIYDIYVYLYICPEILRKRMENSFKNQKYLIYDIKEWQEREIRELRRFCHQHNKDFYVIDNPPENGSEDVDIVIKFFKQLKEGYSCYKFAEKCAEHILASTHSEEITLMDGDKTLITEDSSKVVCGYSTCLYDGNYYTGYQTWKQSFEFEQYEVPEAMNLFFDINPQVSDYINEATFILSSGNNKIWEKIASIFNIPLFAGVQMAAETKLYITKILQASGRKVIAFGDNKNDYYMLRQANQGFLLKKSDGSISKSLVGMDLEGIHIV